MLRITQLPVLHVFCSKVARNIQAYIHQLSAGPRYPCMCVRLQVHSVKLLPLSILKDLKHVAGVCSHILQVNIKDLPPS